MSNEGERCSSSLLNRAGHRCNDPMTPTHGIRLATARSFKLPRFLTPNLDPLSCGQESPGLFLCEWVLTDPTNSGIL
jgi:hypothetical protein